jgi:hypothetical protein
MRLASIFAIFVCVVAFASAHVYFKETFDGKLHLLEGHSNAIRKRKGAILISNG